MSEAKEVVKPNGAPVPPQAEPPSKTLVQKLCEVMGAVGYTQKTGWNEAQKYHYVTEADIAEKIRPELAKRNVIIFPTLVSTTRTKIERNYFDKFDKCMKTKESWAVDVLMRWTVVDGDNGEQFVCEIPGCSESPGDKGVYVAITGSEKYLLMKLFLLPTGDDPEDDANEPAGSKEAAKAVGAAKVAELKAKKAEAVNVLFYTEPESHRGNFVEFINVREYLSTHPDDEMALRMTFTEHKAKKTKDETALVPAEQLPTLLEQLVGEMGLTVKKLEAR
jgi:hypothetical protein